MYKSQFEDESSVHHLADNAHKTISKFGFFIFLHSKLLFSIISPFVTSSVIANMTPLFTISSWHIFAREKVPNCKCANLWVCFCGPPFEVVTQAKIILDETLLSFFFSAFFSCDLTWPSRRLQWKHFCKVAYWTTNVTSCVISGTLLRFITTWY